LVLWPRVRRLAVFNQAGIRTTLPYLEDLTARWEAGDTSLKSILWREADELSGHMLRSWPRQTWREEGNTDPSRMLDLQVRLGNVARIEEFLAGPLTEGHYARGDNEAIIRAAALLPAQRATDLLVQIIRRNALVRLSACGDLLLLCGASSTKPTEDLMRIGAALVEVLPSDLARRAGLGCWDCGEPVGPGLIVDLVTAASQTDAALAMQAIEHLLPGRRDTRRTQCWSPPLGCLPS
jgi:hypothetical protein